MQSCSESPDVRPGHGSGSLSEFLDRVPWLAKRIDQLQELEIDDAVQERERIWATLLGAVEETLSQDTGLWMAEVAEFNYDGGTVSGAQFVTTLLLDHAIERPWVMEGPFMQRMSEMLGGVQRPGRLKAHRYGLCENHEACNTPRELIEFHEPAIDDGGWVVTLPRDRAEPLGGDLAYGMDSDLGLAGVVPFEAACRLAASLAHQSPASQAGQRRQDGASNGMAQHRERFLREFRRHIDLEEITQGPVNISMSARAEGQPERAYRARVSFLSKPDRAGVVSDTAELLHRIAAMITHIEYNLTWCQDNGKCLLGLPFLTRTSAMPATPQDEVVRLRMLTLPSIVAFFQAFRDFMASWSGLAHWIWRPMNAATSALHVANLAIDSIVPTFGIAALVSGWAATARGLSARIFRPRETIAATHVVKALAIFFQTIGIHVITPEEEAAAFVPISRLIHHASLAVQCMSLALQASVRGLASPLDFVFLENDVAEFVLEGAGDGPTITATPQALTCLGNMIGQDALVFAGQTPGNLGSNDPSKGLDLVASVKDVLSVWGPGKVRLVRQSQAEQQPSTISEIRIGGGSLHPAEISLRPNPDLPAWHWEATDAKDIKWFHVRPDEIPVSLDTKIRIGVAESEKKMVFTNPNQDTSHFPGWFTPIGPSSRNSHCPYANVDNDHRRRSLMEPYTTDIGTREAYYELSGQDFGAQGGQYVYLQGMRRWDRRSMNTVKDTLLDESQGPLELIRKLDKNCALFVSCCTNVMTRARLRDLIAFAAPLLHPERLPCLKDLSQEDSTATILQKLRGRDSFVDWASWTVDHTGNCLAHPNRLRDLILGVLKSLKTTGITPTDEFEVAWLSPRRSSAAIRTPCSKSPWLCILRDDCYSATFACATPICLETDSHHCASRSRRVDSGTGGPISCSLTNGMRSFTLTTRILAHRGLPGRHPSRRWQAGESLPTESLKVGCSYFLNSATAGTVAYIYARDAGPVYRTLIKQSLIPSFIRKRIVARAEWFFVRESNENGSIPCLVGSKRGLGI
ncbi:hypothetical protein VTK26DRAFT_7814 [Humicola hyalothermophila]